MVRQEWKKLFHNRILLLVVIAVIAIPSIYTTLFLGSMWDPYGKADQLPVAVVNKDQAVFYEGKELKIGEELTEKLKEDDSLDFCFTDEKQRTDGWQTENVIWCLRYRKIFRQMQPLSQVKTRKKWNFHMKRIRGPTILPPK